MIANSHNSFGSVAKVLHWSVAVLVIAVFVLGVYMHELPRADPNREFVYSLHKTLGVVAFFLALLRVLWAVANPVPKPFASPNPSGWHQAEIMLARIVHGLLYGAILALPLTGWIGHAASTRNFAPIRIDPLNSLPFVPQSRALSRAFFEIHHTLPAIMIICLILHIAGALKHHFITQDDTLRRIIPFWKPVGNHPVHRDQPLLHTLVPFCIMGLYLLAVVIALAVILLV